MNAEQMTAFAAWAAAGVALLSILVTWLTSHYTRKQHRGLDEKNRELQRDLHSSTQELQQSIARVTREHQDNTWHREHLFEAVSRFFDASNEAMNYMRTDIIVAAGAGSITQEMLDEFRSMQKRIHSARQRMLILAPFEVIEPANRWVGWLDGEIQGFPVVGRPGRPMSRTDPLVLSVNEGDSLFQEMVNPIRSVLGSEGHFEIVVTGSPNTYGH